MHFTSVKQLAASLALLACTSAAWAQYVWTDERGVKQFSDMPPPASVPKNRILKQPREAASGSGETSAAATPSADDSADDSAAKAPLTTAEKNADFIKRRTEQAEKDKKAAQEAQAARDKAKNCENAGNYQRALASGQRIARTGNNGERVYLSDEERNRELQEANRTIGNCK